jgi:hypothetical protein
LIEANALHPARLANSLFAALLLAFVAAIVHAVRPG